MSLYSSRSFHIWWPDRSSAHRLCCHRSSAGAALTWARNVLVTFLLSGFWHGASWNYVLWGLYHGVLLLATRAHQILRGPKRLPAGATAAERSWFRIGQIAQIAGMFALSLFGWLLFRETDLSAIVRDLRLAPWHSTPFDRQAGVYLFLLAFGYSLPLWLQSIWVELDRIGAARTSDDPPPLPVGLVKAFACGMAFAAILLLRSRTSLDFIYFHF
jgi:alginate O-acetyltransferase complex protein AlgI